MYPNNVEQVNQGIAFTDSSLRCCDLTRFEIKRLCQYNQLSVAKFALISDLNQYYIDDWNQLVRKIGGFPLLVEFEYHNDNIEINEKSMIHDVARREFTVFIIGSGQNIHVFSPVEYQFYVNKTVIAFEDKCSTNYARSNWRLMEGQQNTEEQEIINDFMISARQLYEAIEDYSSNLSLFYRDSYSIDCAIEASGWFKAQLVKFPLEDALERQRKYHLIHSNVVKFSEKSGFGLYSSCSLIPGEIIYSLESASLKFTTKKYAEETFNDNDMLVFKNYGKRPRLLSFFQIDDNDIYSKKSTPTTIDKNCTLLSILKNQGKPLN
ncbi:unnamed protein product [Rotaria socialis]|uniref:Uncharacterized protein n=1 Tax=Rotaria socialis TaxID=392032 RepID=A0A819W047_9BILA|nr:unnamed protein product [Rotaria socialis]CAF4116035.1 unnamed protein product [Rotaria socialis]